ncbi:MAG: mercuric transporter MerT family protein [Ghiorsea sp.]
MMKNKTPGHSVQPLIAAIVAGALASACCLGPFIFMLLGLGSASIFFVLDDYRPIFAVMTVCLLLWAGYQQFKTHEKILQAPHFWIGSIFVLLLLFSPTFIEFAFNKEWL